MFQQYTAKDRQSHTHTHTYRNDHKKKQKIKQNKKNKANDKQTKFFQFVGAYKSVVSEES